GGAGAGGGRGRPARHRARGAAGPGRPPQGGGGGHDRPPHRRARRPGVARPAAADHGGGRAGRQDRAARGGEGHLAPGAGERGPAAGGGAGPDGDGVGLGGGVLDGVAVLVVVPGRGDDHGAPGVDGVVDGGLVHAGRGGPGQRQVDDVGAVVGRPPDPVGDGGGPAAA